jgi:hypothetical protein
VRRRLCVMTRHICSFGAHGKIARSAVLAVVNCSLCAFAFGGDLSVPTPKHSVPVAEIPIKLYQQYLIVVDGRLGNLDHQNLLLDTGSSPSMIDNTVALKLGLKGTPRGLSLFNKNVASESLMLPDLQLGPVRRQNLQVMAADFSKIGRDLGTRIDAVIGLDVFGDTSFTVDYAKRRIVFGASLEAHTASFAIDRQFITVNLKSGARQLHLLLDTGTQQLILFEDHLRGVDYFSSAISGSGRNVSGTFSYGTIVLPQIKIGKKDLGPQWATVVASQSAVGNDFDGLLGISCFRPKRVSFDFQRQILGWTD